MEKRVFSGWSSPFPQDQTEGSAIEMQAGGREKYNHIYNLVGQGPHCTIKRKRLIIQEPHLEPLKAATVFTLS